MKRSRWKSFLVTAPASEMHLQFETHSFDPLGQLWVHRIYEVSHFPDKEGEACVKSWHCASESSCFEADISFMMLSGLPLFERSLLLSFGGKVDRVRTLLSHQSQPIIMQL